ncbi:unnamed protein product [Linum trigynum]|uniref:Transposase MuDR plant domain-containing protein n=1 Tax=Linum trigynum TaxID=586398 RepID=A0AAV2FQT8_9ROSI
MEDALPGLVSDLEDEEEEDDVSAYSFNPLEGTNDSGLDSDDDDDDEVSRDRVLITYYNYIPNENWYVDADMEPPEVPVWGPLTWFTKGQQFDMKKEVRHAVDTEAMIQRFEWRTTHSDPKRLIVRCQNQHKGCKARDRAIKSKRVGHWVISPAVNNHMFVINNIPRSSTIEI